MEFIWKSLKIPLSCVRLRQPNVCHLTNKPSKWLIPSNGIKWNIESVWIFWCPIYSFMNVNKYLISEENKLQFGSLHSFLMVFSCFGINFIVSSCFVIGMRRAWGSTPTYTIMLINILNFKGGDGHLYLMYNKYMRGDGHFIVNITNT